MTAELLKDHDTMNNPILAVIRFSTARQARSCHMTLQTLFDRIDRKVKDMYEAGGGVATLEALSAIYADFGFTNDNGWEPEEPLSVDGNEVLWPLPTGVHTEEVENLLEIMAPLSIEFHPLQRGFPSALGTADADTSNSHSDFFEDPSVADEDWPDQPPKRSIH